MTYPLSHRKVREGIDSGMGAFLKGMQVSDSTIHIPMNGRAFSVAWHCHYRDHTTYILREFGTGRRADIEVSDSGEFGRSFGDIDQATTERLIVEYERIRREQFVQWCSRQSYSVNPNEYPPHAVLANPKPYGRSEVIA